MQKRMVALAATFIIAGLTISEPAQASKPQLSAVHPGKHARTGKHAGSRHNRKVTTAVAAAGPARGAEAAAVRGSMVSYRVKKRDTVASVAAHFGVDPSSIRKANRLRGGHLKVGQLLRIAHAPKAPEPSQPVAATPRQQSPYVLEALRSDSDRQLEASLAEETGVRQLTDYTEIGTGRIETIKKGAFSLLGTKYVFGGASRSGIDCSAFVQTVFKGAGTSMPRTAREQYRVGDNVPLSELQRGDLLFFRTYASFPSHVGIYLGNNRMIHASSREHRVTISPFDTAYFRQRFIGAKRVGRDAGGELLSELTEPLSFSGEEGAVLASAGGVETVRLLLQKAESMGQEAGR